MDLIEYREKAIEACGIFKAEQIVMELVFSSNSSPIEASLELVRQADVYVCIIGQRYGSVKDGYDKSITHLEYEEARRLGKPCHFFVASEYADDREPNLENLYNEISQKHVFYKLNNSHDMLIGLLNTFRKYYFPELELDGKYLIDLESKYIKESWHGFAMDFISNQDSLSILRKFEEDYNGVDGLLQSFIDSKERAPRDLDDLLDKCGLDKSKLSQVPYYENRFNGNTTESVMASHNWMSSLRLDYLNIKVRLLEYECQRFEDKKLIEELERVKKELADYVGISYID